MATTLPIFNDSNSNSSGQGTSSNYIGNYGNLPAGITNAGGGANNAYVRQVQPNELVSNQLNDILSSNSPYIQQARQQGLNTAASRGLLNSSMAAGNAQSAAIQAGLPIAQGNATAYGTAAGQNLDALNSILANTQNNRTSMANANTAAGASMYNSGLQYQLGLKNIDYQGQQAGLNRGFQDYMAQQGYNNQMRNNAFNLGANLLQSNNNFNNNLWLQASQNPFMIQNPDALQGYANAAGANSQNYYGDLFGYAMNGGQSPGNWYENSQYYQTPYQANPGSNAYGSYYGSPYGNNNGTPSTVNTQANYPPYYGYQPPAGRNQGP